MDFLIYLRPIFQQNYEQVMGGEKSLSLKKITTFQKVKTVLILGSNRILQYKQDMEDFDVDFIKLLSGQLMVGQWAIAVGLVRKKVLEARAKPNENFIKLRVNLPDGLEFQYTDSATQQKTRPGVRALAYTISVNTIYPDPNNLLLEGRPIRFNATYTKTYEISHFLGIMIAEQIRFSTLSDSVNDPKYAIKNVGLDWNALFNFFFENFKLQIYNNWKQSGAGPVTTKLLNGNTVVVQILVPWRAGP